MLSKERLSLVVILLSLAVIALAGGGTVWLCVLAFLRQKQLPKAAMILTWLIIVVCVLGAISTALGIVSMFAGVGGVSVDPSQQARILGEGMSQTINCATLCLLVWFPSIIALAVLLVLKREPSA